MLLDFSHNKKDAFLNGFVKGLAAPIMLFGMFPIPPLADITYISTDTISQKSLYDDWNVIGSDFAKVISTHGKTD